MQVKDIKQSGLTHEFEVTIPANDIDARVEGKLKEVGATVRIQGFRPGKVPMNILKQRYGTSVMGEVLESAVNETSTKIMKDKKIIPAMQPKIEVKSFDVGADLVYSMVVDTLPEIKLKDFKGIKLEKLVAVADDAAVDEALGRIAEGAQATVPITGKRACKEGDTIVIDFDGRTADDDVKHDGMASEAHHLLLGGGQFIPGFEDQLIGKKAGDEVEVKVDFPAEYGAKDLAGRAAIFECKIHEIREPGEAKIDDDFAKTLGLDSLAKLKEAVTEQLSAEYEKHSRLVLKKNLLDHLDDAYDFEIPATMLEQENQNILDQVKMDRKQHGEPEEITKAEEKEFAAIGERRVRLGLVLSQIGNENKITISDPELQKSVITEAQRYPGQEKEVFDYYAKNPQALESLRAPLYEEKVVDFIVELADIKDKKVSPEELSTALDDDHDDSCSDASCGHADHGKKKTAAKKDSAKKKAPAKKASATTKKAPAKKKTPAKKTAAKKPASKKKAS